MLGVAIGTYLCPPCFMALSQTLITCLPSLWLACGRGWLGFGLLADTDPVSSVFTDTGKLIYGFFIGVLVVLVRG